MSSLIPFIPVIVKVLFWFLETMIFNKGVDKESRRIFLELSKVLRTKYNVNVVSRFESEKEQIQEGEDFWDNEEQKAKDGDNESNEV